MSERNINRLLVVLCILIAIVGFNLWPFFGKGFFYKALALHFICTYTTGYRLSRHIGDRDVFAVKGMLIGVALSFSNLLDEVYFDPEKIQSNEYVAAGVIAFLLCLPRRVWKK